jgi:hypothetical protein
MRGRREGASNKDVQEQRPAQQQATAATMPAQVRQLSAMRAHATGCPRSLSASVACLRPGTDGAGRVGCRRQPRQGGGEGGQLVCKGGRRGGAACALAEAQEFAVVFSQARDANYPFLLNLHSLTQAQQQQPCTTQPPACSMCVGLSVKKLVLCISHQRESALDLVSSSAGAVQSHAA